jgi:hypothetical protein
MRGGMSETDSDYRQNQCLGITPFVLPERLRELRAR